ncbi:MAG: DUF3971 domain-containing protein, partial [Aestuariivirgaceae bacterium]
MLFALLSIGAIGAMAFAGVMWRLSEGPLPLSFLTSTIQRSMNDNLTGMKVSISDVIIERDQVTGQPRFRLRDLALRDLDGHLIARAPRASVGVDGQQLLTGSVVASKLELIGARLMVRRKVDGSFQLGFGETGAAARRGPGDGAQQPVASKAGREDRDASTPELDGGKLLDLINEQMLAAGSSNNALAEIETILVSQASISLFDESNDSVWFAPRSNLVFKRAPYGFAVFVDATVASGDEPWRSELVVTYRRSNRAFTISARVFDLIPADIADDVFALSQLAQVKLPLSGHIEVELTETGVVTKASAELSTSEGRLDFPQYISKPVLIDEGLLRFDYEPDSGDVVIGNSAIFVDGVRSDLQGRIQPIRSAQGQLDALRMNLQVRNVNIRSDAGAEAQPSIDRIEFTGVAGIKTAELEVEDLILFAGDAGVRVRGRFVGEGDAIGMYLAGRIRDLPVRVVKKLWPPVGAPRVRTWLRENVDSAMIPQGTFQLKLPGTALVAAIRDKIAIPDELVDLKFELTDVATNYFGELPPITGAAGRGHVQGNHFHLELARGIVTLPSGNKLEFVNGTMDAENLAPLVTPVVIRVTGAGKARDFLELLDQKPLGLIKESGFDPSRLTGETQLDISFAMPMQKEMTADMVKIDAGAKLTDVALKNAVNGLDIDSGTLDLTFGAGEVSAEGPVRIKGIPVKLNWTRKLAKNGPGLDKISARAELDEADRRKLGADLSSHLSGPVDVTMTAETRSGGISEFRVDADLTKAALRLDPIRWSRKAGRKTTASFDVDLSDGKRTRINNLKITGKDLKIAGNLTVDAAGGLREAAFSDVLLNDLNHFAIVMKKRND